MRPGQFLLTITLALGCLATYGQGNQSEWWVLKRNTPQPITGQRIVADAEGNLTVILDTARNVSTTIKRGDYVRVHTPTPQVINQLAAVYNGGDYERVIKGAEQIFDSLKYLGWADEIGYYEGMSYVNRREFQKAIEVFEKAMRYTFMDEEKAKLNKGMIEAYMGLEKFDEAEKQLNQLSTKDPATAAYAYNLRGRLYEKEGKQRDAVLQHLKVVLLFTDAGSIRKQSYEHVVNLLKEMGDQRWKDFEREMKAEYP